MKILQMFHKPDRKRIKSTNNTYPGHLAGGWSETAETSHLQTLKLQQDSAYTMY